MMAEQMQVIPEGYKQTEIGLIPDDWVISRIIDRHVIATGNTPFTTDHSNYGDEYLFVSPADLDGRKYISATVKKLSQKGFNWARKFPSGSTLFTCIGSTIGKTGLATIELTSNQQINAVFPNNSDCHEFVYYALDFIAPKIKLLAGEQAVPIVNKTDFGETKYALPPSVKEQTAIANALSDVDALISKLEKLIAKKQAIKTAAMQQLLTGKIRLPQFALREDGSPKGYKASELGEMPEDWEVYCLDEIIQKTQLGGNYQNSEQESDYPLIKMGNLDRGVIKLDKIEFVTKKPSKNDKLYYGDVLFNTRNTLELVGKVAIWRNELPQAYFNSNLMRFIFNDELVSNNFYINAVMNSKKFITALSGIATGTTSVAAIYARDLLNLKIFLPSKKEQVAIASILFDIDEEIQTLQQRLNKTRQIKQGMMQELLTGKTRLVKKPEVTA